ncbi:MAG: DUF814 domain-containing protein [Candidatus Moranbacteria bacterium]|nr:DUF814 domain-containing protein [Candidatus Moranbacteria bacterium]
MAIKALLLFSGGLDSLIAGKILQKNNIQVTGLNFTSLFINNNEVKKSAQILNIPLITKKINQKQLALVKKPEFGYGKNLNPCVDCHLLMLNIARQYLINGRFQILATGEVLGQRPFSQNIQTFQLIEKKLDLRNKILRPLSGKLLSPTVYQQKGLINRQSLLTISGKSRKKQFAFVKNLGFSDLPTPAGGCLLTDPGFSKKLKILLKSYPEAKKSQVQMLKTGRLIKIDQSLIILGRNKVENQKLENLAQSKDMLIKPKNFPGPTAYLNQMTVIKPNKLLSKIKKIIIHYSSNKKISPKAKFSIIEK